MFGPDRNAFLNCTPEELRDTIYNFTLSGCVVVLMTIPNWNDFYDKRFIHQLLVKDEDGNGYQHYDETKFLYVTNDVIYHYMLKKIFFKKYNFENMINQKKKKLFSESNIFSLIAEFLGHVIIGSNNKKNKKIIYKIENYKKSKPNIYDYFIDKNRIFVFRDSFTSIEYPKNYANLRHLTLFQNPEKITFINIDLKKSFSLSFWIMLAILYCKNTLIIYTEILPADIVNIDTTTDNTLIVHLNRCSYKQLMLTLCDINLIPLKRKEKNDSVCIESHKNQNSAIIPEKKQMIDIKDSLELGDDFDFIPCHITFSFFREKYNVSHKDININLKNYILYTLRKGMSISGEIKLQLYDTGTYKYNKNQQNDDTMPHIEIRILPTNEKDIVIGGYIEEEFSKNSNSSSRWNIEEGVYNCIYVYIPLGKHIMKELDRVMKINEDKYGLIRLNFHHTCNYTPTSIPSIIFKYLPTIDGNIAGNIIVHGNEKCIYVCIPLKYCILKRLDDDSIDKNKIKFEYYNEETYLDECDEINIKDKIREFKYEQPKIIIVASSNEKDVIMVGGIPDTIVPGGVIKPHDQNSDCVYVSIPEKYKINDKRKFNEI